jgi:WD40 repeat protein/serine/threonine protein kinase
MSANEDNLNPLDQLAEEFISRLRLGERPSISEFCARDPARAAEIHEFLSAVAMLEEVRPRTETLCGSAVEPARLNLADSAPVMLGDYRLLREVGRGGMGIVYEAEQHSLHRRVAIKVLPVWATASQSQVRRFYREAASAAALHHTNIVPVFGVGEDAGVHYYVMPFIEGSGLDKVLANVRRTPRTPASDSSTATLSGSGETHWRDVASIGLHVAEALDYAASQGVLHRDIKPSNLLLDSQGTIWVTDFGLAKRADGEDLTATGDVLGTLRYLAPERLHGVSDLRGDIYGLGITLYELLTLNNAFSTLDRSHLAELILHHEPKSPRAVDPAIPRDLETIVLKAIAKQPTDRYQSAADMADDLRLFLEDRPIRSRRIRPTERMWRWCRRNPLLASLEAAVALLCLSAVVILAIANASIRHMVVEKSAALDAKSDALEAEEAAVQQRDAAVTRAHANEQLAERRFFATQMSLAAVDFRENDWSLVLDALNNQRPQPGKSDLRGFEWHYLWRQIHRGLHRSFRQDPGEILDLAFSPDGKTLAVASGHDARGGSVGVWSVATGEPLRMLASGMFVSTSVAFSPDGRFVIAGLTKDCVKVWDAESGEEIRRLETTSVVRSADWSPDGRFVAAGCQEGEVLAWETYQWQRCGTLTPHGGPVLGLVFARDGKQLFTSAAWGSEGLMSRLHDFSGPTPRTVRDLPRQFICDVQPNGDQVATLDWADFRLIDLASGAEKYMHTIGAGSVSTARISPDGRRHASAGRDNRMGILWDRESQQRIVQGPHSSPVMSVAFDPNSRYWATGSSDGEVKIWHYDLPNQQVEITHEPPIQRFMVADEALIVGGNFPAEARNLRTGKAEVLPPIRNPRCVSADGSTFVEVVQANESLPESIRIWDWGSNALKHEFRLPDKGGIAEESLAISRTGRWLAARTWDGPVRLWDLAGEEATEARNWQPGDCMGLNFSPNERLLAGACQFGRVRLWDLESGQTLPDVWPYESVNIWCQRVAFSPDGTRLAAGDHVGVVRVFEIPSQRLLSTLKGHLGQTLALQWFPDGKTLAVAGTGPIRLWDVEIGQECLTIPVPDYRVFELALSADAQTLFSRSDHGVVRVFDSARRGP